MRLYDYYAKGGTECVLCKRKIGRPVNRDQHARVHIRNGEAEEVRFSISHNDYYVTTATTTPDVKDEA